ncbi:MFS transporter [Rudaeicoccus suwonensis]|uniref:EmrB/QacA subfamily drug resistance transporter n=1 Tax=Rudaeicoccus suwonensis TaxID=657409 RepID=A0A561EBL3_9MICO|nr:MFS transporter [Rudaeicoccus suwonensis]TWE12987.1 EmrB/QacA subfamily drug resistance transporter [Rudaeicoccus suwonensis]
MSITTAQDDATSARVSRPGISLTLICTAMFMLMLDLTIVAVALPDIQRDLGSNLSDLQWVVDAYTLPLAALLLTAATMGDRIGRRTMFSSGMAVFTLGSLMCALSVDPMMLNLMRGLQGIGAAMLFATTMPILGHAYPDLASRAKAVGIFGAVLASATAVGPLLGGAIVDHLGWKWIFAINVPIGIAAFVAARRYLPQSKAAVPRAADWIGTALLTVALAALVFGLIRGQSAGWSSAQILGAFAVSVLALIGFVIRAAVVDEPMVDLELFRRPGFVGIGLSGFVIAGTIVAATNYVGLYFVNSLGFSPFGAGLRFLPLSLAAFVAAPVTAQLGRQVPPVVTLPASLVTVAVGLLWASRIDAHSGWLALAPGLALAGVGLGASSAVMSAAALASVEPDRAGMATGVVNTLRQVGTAAGVAALGAVFTSNVRSRVTADLGVAQLPRQTVATISGAVESGAGKLVAAHAPAADRSMLANVAVDATAHGIHSILLIGGVVSTGSIVVVAGLLLLARRRGEGAAEKTHADQRVVAEIG